MDVGDDSALGDGHSTQKTVELLIVPDGQLKVTGDDPGLLVVPGSVPSQLEDFGSEVLHDSGEVDGGTSSNPLSVVASAEMTMDPSNWELETGPGGSRLLLLGSSFLGLLHGRVGHGDVETLSLVSVVV